MSMCALFIIKSSDGCAWMLSHILIAFLQAMDKKAIDMRAVQTAPGQNADRNTLTPQSPNSEDEYMPQINYLVSLAQEERAHKEAQHKKRQETMQAWPSVPSSIQKVHTSEVYSQTLLVYNTYASTPLPINTSSKATCSNNRKCADNRHRTHHNASHRNKHKNMQKVFRNSSPSSSRVETEDGCAASVVTSALSNLGSVNIISNLEPVNLNIATQPYIGQTLTPQIVHALMLGLHIPKPEPAQVTADSSVCSPQQNSGISKHVSNTVVDESTSRPKSPVLIPVLGPADKFWMHVLFTHLARLEYYVKDSAGRDVYKQYFQQVRDKYFASAESYGGFFNAWSERWIAK
ncbi:hypothetical protein NEOKW01_2129 [Nematocida sp. AWRm80]|nr:hypothetical protein NEOKW01_2129 [Nematocida sp. AWRm80]